MIFLTPGYKMELAKMSRNTKLQKRSSENRKWQSTALTNVLLSMLLLSAELLQKAGYCVRSNATTTAEIIV
jgi:hypothetical protein